MICVWGGWVSAKLTVGLLEELVSLQPSPDAALECRMQKWNQRKLGGKKYSYCFPEDHDNVSLCISLYLHTPILHTIVHLQNTYTVQLNWIWRKHKGWIRFCVCMYACVCVHMCVIFVFQAFAALIRFWAADWALKGGSCCVLEIRLHLPARLITVFVCLSSGSSLFSSLLSVSASLCLCLKGQPW